MTTETTAVTVLERAAVALGSSKAEAELTTLAAKSQSITAITNPAGREECHAAAMVAKQARIAVEKTAKTAREDATLFSKAVIAEGSRLVALIEPEESRLIALRDAWDSSVAREKAAKAEAERIALAQIKTRVDNIKAWPLLAATASPANVLDDIARLEALEIDDSFGASYGEAVEAKAVSLAKLREIHAAKVAAETEACRIRDELAAQAERNRLEREELDRRRAEQKRADDAAQVEREAEEQRLADARAEIAAAQHVLDKAKAAEAARIAAEAAAAQKVIDDAAAEAKRAADAVAEQKLHDLAAQQAEQRLAEKSQPAPAANDRNDGRVEMLISVSALAEIMDARELGLFIHYGERLIQERRAAA